MYELQYSMPSSVNDAVAEIKKSSESKFLVIILGINHKILNFLGFS